MKYTTVVTDFKDLKKAIEEVTKKQPAKSRYKQQAEKMGYTKDKAVVAEQKLSEASALDGIKDIVKTKGAKKVNGVMVDMFTASVITQAYDKVNDSNKKKMEKANVQTLVKLAQKVMGMKEETDHDLNEEVENLQEGTWAIPDSYKKLYNLQVGFLQMPSKPTPNNAKRMAKNIYDIFGDDDFFDDLLRVEKGMDGAETDDLRNLIVKHLEPWGLKFKKGAKYQITHAPEKWLDNMTANPAESAKKRKSGNLKPRGLGRSMKVNLMADKLDPVGKADADIDNDGDVDSSDKYLKKRRAAISKAMKEDLDEAKKFTVKKLGDDYYPYGLYYNNNLVSGLKSNSKQEVNKAIKSISKALGVKEDSELEKKPASELTPREKDELRRKKMRDAERARNVAAMDAAKKKAQSDKEQERRKKERERNLSIGKSGETFRDRQKRLGKSQTEQLQSAKESAQRSPFKLKSQAYPKALGIETEGFGVRHATREDIVEACDSFGMITDQELQVEQLQKTLGKNGFLTYNISELNDVFDERETERMILALESVVEDEPLDPIVYTRSQIDEALETELEIEFVKPDGMKAVGPILKMCENTYNVKDKHTGKSFTFKYEDEDDMKTFKQITEAKFPKKLVRMAGGIAFDKRYVGGNYTGAVKAIEKIKKGLSDDPEVKRMLRLANEAFNNDFYKALSEKEKTEYQKFFQSVLKKFGVKSPAELSGDKEKEFYNYIDKNWSGKTETDEWISQDGTRRRVKEGDRRKTKDEDVKKHDCATHVEHAVFGSGKTISGQHTLVQEGEQWVVTHYDVEFEHGIEEMVSVQELAITKQESHAHAMAKKAGRKKMKTKEQTRIDGRRRNFREKMRKLGYIKAK